jgi:hypothetical protein
MVESLGLEHDAPGVVEPGGARAIEVELDPVAVGVGQVDRDARAVVGRVIDRVTAVDQSLDGTAQLAPVGIQERDVVEAGVAGRRRIAARAVPGVEGDVVVVVAGGEKAASSPAGRPLATSPRPRPSR